MKQLFIATLLLSFALSPLAADYSSGGFTVRDPVIAEYGGRGLSASFGQINSGGQAAIGESSSGSFIIKSGFLYFTDLIAPPPPPPPPPPLPKPGPVPVAPGGGGGPLMPTPAPVSGIVFSGIAYPLQPVILLKDGQIIATVNAGVAGEFSLAAHDLNSGSYGFGLLGTDINNQAGAIFFLINFEKGLSRRFDDIILPPTIALDPSLIFGQTAPLAEVAVAIGGLTKKIIADSQGLYSLSHKNLGLKDDIYKVKSEALLVDGRRSPPSREITLNLKKGVPEISQCPLVGDLNADCRVNLIDLSIMAYWWNHASPPVKTDLNGDGKINLIDFSILVYYWTG